MVQNGSLNQIVILMASINVFLSCFLKFGLKVFQQPLGITMESDPALLMANCFLFYYEDKLIRWGQTYLKDQTERQNSN